MNENNESNILLNENEPMNALILLSETKDGLQIDKLSAYCVKWKFNINLTKTKIMIIEETVLSNRNLV